MENSSSRLLDTINAIRINTKEVWTQEECALYTGISVNYLHQLTSQREIPHYKCRGKLYFKRTEIEDWMTAEKRYTKAENERRAEAYDRNRKKRMMMNV